MAALLPHLLGNRPLFPGNGILLLLRSVHSYTPECSLTHSDSRIISHKGVAMLTTSTPDVSASARISLPVDGITFHAVQAGLWVARRDGVFAGMIEQQWGRGFTVTTSMGRALGLFATIDDAQQALRD